MKFYLVTIQYNKDADAENRPIPKKYDTLLEAESAFYSQVGTDMKTSTLGGSLNFVCNSEGGFYSDLKKKWGNMEKVVESASTATDVTDEETTEA